MHPNTIANGQPDPILQPPGLVVYDGTVQLPDFGGYDPTLSLPGLGVHGPTPQIGVYGPLPGFGEYGPTLPLPSLGVYGPAPQLLDLGVYDGMGAAADCFANFNPFTQRGDLTAIDPQATMTSFNQLSLPTTASMLAAPALAPVLPVHTSNMFTAPVVPPQITRSSNVNINARTCNFPKCGKVLTRKSGLRRHQKSHFPPEFHCLVHGCKYRDEKGFTRADKLRDHQRRGHRMAI
ncbi:hypothetical protein BJ875DRAFT_240437 [Amylocarpus encephaloides]|uniref:C2H2-type domain-containing protein n=1 Tax=Amylocarpus encephaloides TaxID=45428 RepID=A0A9P7Y6L5_9HELO|nr:hypothetical protein BJ875DRAFT_240437 [Amylocarpus encephaloides]